jgi:hypothetical protein
MLSPIKTQMIVAALRAATIIWVLSWMRRDSSFEMRREAPQL